MSRVWTDNANPDGTKKYSRGVPGTEKETAELVRKGFDPAPSSGNGDFCYYSPARGLIWLFPDNTWFGEKISPGKSLEDYLNTIPEVDIDERFFKVVQIEAGFSNNLWTMGGVGLTAYLGTRVDDETKITTLLSELG